MNKSIKSILIIALSLIAFNCVFPPRVSVKTGIATGRGVIFLDTTLVHPSAKRGLKIDHIGNYYDKGVYYGVATIDFAKLMTQNVLVVSVACILLSLVPKGSDDS